VGDINIAQDLLGGVMDALVDLGAKRTLKLISVPAIDTVNPGAERSETWDTEDLDALLFEYEDKYMPGSSVRNGSTLAILSIIELTDAQVSLIKPGSRLVDGQTEYEIIKTNPIEVAGIIVTIIVQLKG